MELTSGLSLPLTGSGPIRVRVYVTYFDVPATVANPFIPAANPGVCPF